MKDAAQEYEEKQEKYYQGSHELHQTEQKFLKLKRRVLNIMQENNLEQIDADQNFSVRLVKRPSKVIIYDQHVIPSKFASMHRIIDTVKVKNALSKGEKIPGAYLEMEPLEVSLTLKTLS